MTIDQVLSTALLIGGETQAGANTAPRVGGELELLARIAPLPYSASFGYTAGMLAIFQGRVFYCLLATSAGQSPLTHGPYSPVQKWTHYAATNVLEVGADLPDLNVGTRLLANYVEYILASRPNTNTPTLAQVAVAGTITDKTLTVGGLQAPVWEEVTTTTHVFVEKLVSGQRKLVKISLANLKALIGGTTGGGGGGGIITPGVVPVYRILRIYREVEDIALTLPDAPTNLRLLSPAAATNLYYLAWTDNSSNEAGFRFEWAVGPTAPFAPLGTVGSNSTEMPNTITGYNPLLTNRFRVQSYNAVGASAWATLTVVPNQTERLITGLRARVLPAGNNFRFEIQVLSLVPIDVEFQFTQIDGTLLSGFAPPLSATFGLQTWWETISPGSLAIATGLFGFGSVEARPAGNNSERSGEYTKITASGGVGPDWVPLILGRFVPTGL